MTDTIDDARIRGARAMLDLSMVDLAKSAGVSVATVRRMQDGEPATVAAFDAVQHALEAEGALFLDDDGAGPGVRARKRHHDH